MATHPLLPGNFRIIFHDNDVCDFSLNECVMGLEAYEMQQMKRLMMTGGAKDERLTLGMRDFLSHVPQLSILGATKQEIEERPEAEAGCNVLECLYPYPQCRVVIFPSSVFWLADYRCTSNS